MIRSSFLALGLLLAVGTAPLASAADAGSAYCFGVACPCGNDDPNAGCRNSSGAGALLSATGSSSASAADLSMSVTGLPTSCVAILVIGDQQKDVPFKDGRLCVGGQTWRLFKHQNSGQGGQVAFDGVQDLFLLNSPPIVFQAGDAWNFQSWYRDSPGNQSSCGQKSNVSNAYAVTFTP